MTLDEAIWHAREVALSNTTCSAAYRKSGQILLADSCDACAAEQTQIADWLEELKQRRGRTMEISALEGLRKQINETGQVKGISGTIVQSVRPCVASGVRAAIQTLIDLTNNEIIAQEDEWILCNERLPEKYGEYQVYFGTCDCDLNSTDAIDKRYYGEKSDGTIGWHSLCSNDITHWMPLPKPPKKE